MYTTVTLISIRLIAHSTLVRPSPCARRRRAAASSMRMRCDALYLPLQFFFLTKLDFDKSLRPLLCRHFSAFPWRQSNGPETFGPTVRRSWLRLYILFGRPVRTTRQNASNIELDASIRTSWCKSTDYMYCISFRKYDGSRWQLCNTYMQYLNATYLSLAGRLRSLRSLRL